MNRAAIASAANAAAPTLPALSASSDRKELICWLTACDPSGCYSDADSVAEYGAALTPREAWECIALTIDATELLED